MTRVAQAADGPEVPLPHVAEMVAEAEEMFTHGRLEDAWGRLAELLPLAYPDSGLQARIHSDLAVIAARRGSWAEAAGLASEALTHCPGHTPALEVLEYCSNAREQATSAHSREIQASRIEQFRELSTCIRVRGAPILNHPVLLIGRGQISFGSSVHFGCHHSPGYYDRYAYIEACYHDTLVEIGDNTFFNNGATLRAYGPGISVGSDCLFGWAVQVLDSDFHELNPRRRQSGTAVSKHVRIGDNVFIGSNVVVMKGVVIGDDTVVGARSVVSRSLPAGVIAAGNPARVIRALDE
jgi:galactoside O-acetyltransferase